MECDKNGGGGYDNDDDDDDDDNSCDYDDDNDTVANNNDEVGDNAAADDDDDDDDDNDDYDKGYDGGDDGVVGNLDKWNYDIDFRQLWVFTTSTTTVMMTLCSFPYCWKSS